MSNAQNGARIKAFAGKGVGSGVVKNITFNMFVETNVDHPIIVDQVSCPLVASARRIFITEGYSVMKRMPQSARNTLLIPTSKISGSTS